MASSTYKPLTGREIREIINYRLKKEVNELKYLREGNSFHNVNVQVAVVITAFPADVPVPNLDLAFDIPSKGFNEIEEALNQVAKAEELARIVERIEEAKSRVETLLNQALEMRASIVFESEREFGFDGNTPDKTRMENDLPVTIEKVERGKRVETKVASTEFKKMAKL